MILNMNTAITIPPTAYVVIMTNLYFMGEASPSSKRLAADDDDVDDGEVY